jgi:dolichol-phosphate mannosyltransferase
LKGIGEIQMSVVLPAYEEAENLRWLLPELKMQIESTGAVAEILVVDTEVPRDDTPAICEAMKVKCLPRKGGPLYSHALKTGIAASTGRWILCMDADGSHSPDFLPVMWGARDKADLIVASRYVSGGSTENPAVLILLSYMVNVIFRLVLGIRCRDLSNSFRLYRGDSLRALDLDCRNFDVIEEILLKLSLRNPRFTILELPFTFKTRKEGRTKRDLLAFSLGYLGTLRRLYRLKKSSEGIHP